MSTVIISFGRALFHSFKHNTTWYFQVVDQVPIPAKCSTQLRKLIHSHSVTKPPVNGGGLSEGVGFGSGSKSECSESYSPYGSPTSSPRVRRKPLRETKRVNSTVQSDGEYVQLNQYKLEQGAIGQVRFNSKTKTWKLAVNRQKNFSSILSLSKLLCKLFISRTFQKSFLRAWWRISVSNTSYGYSGLIVA